MHDLLQYNGGFTEESLFGHRRPPPSPCRHGRRYVRMFLHESQVSQMKTLSLNNVDLAWLAPHNLSLISDYSAPLYAELSSLDAANICRHLSGNYHGWCWSDGACKNVCIGESSENIGGLCDDLPLRCYCVTNCPPWDWCCYILKKQKKRRLLLLLGQLGSSWSVGRVVIMVMTVMTTKKTLFYSHLFIYFVNPVPIFKLLA